MSDYQTDIIVLGATGFTGRLTTRYLAAHPQFKQGLFSFTIAGRSQSKLHTLVQQLSLPPTIHTIQVDVTNETDVEKAVTSAKVVINTVGPYWLWGSLVVRACARNGIHYVDLTGETVWIREIIQKYEYIATKTGAIIVPSCGMDSVPSDLSVFVGNKTLKAQGEYDVGLSTTMFQLRGGFSGGTLRTILTMLEDVPKEKLRESSVNYALSPVVGRTLPPFRFLYKLAIPGERPKIGSYWFMQPTNRAIVQRTFGLLELQALNDKGHNESNSLTSAANRQRYGSTFAYDEFIAMPSKTMAFVFTAVSIIGLTMMMYFAPARWVLKKIISNAADGPSDENLQKGFVTATNLTVSTSTPPVHVKTVIKGNGDPGYLLSSIMLSESALSLLLPPPSKTAPSLAGFASTSLPLDLPALTRKGGILTPVTAFGDVLVTRLEETGRFQFESRVVGTSGSGAEDRKSV